MSAPSKIKSVLDLVANHIDLLELESRYECASVEHRWRAMAISILCVFSAWILIHVALVDLLARAGAPLYAICFGLSIVDIGVGALLYDRYGRRDAKAGDPFIGSQQEFKRSLEWIQKNFF